MVEVQKTDLATISVEAKARLARLLASENIYVEHRNVKTASFDIKNRVLVLPNWKDITKDLYDLLVCHEVGHALFTPLDGWHGAVVGSGKGPRFKGFLNVLEDARIEKKIKRKFPGARKAFTQGYHDLLERDFFGIGDRDINSFGFIDRINMHFKGGSVMGITFNDAEQVFVDRIEKAETWEEVEALANELWDIAKEEAETDTSQGPEPQSGPTDGEGDEGELGEMGEGNGPSGNDDDDSADDGSEEGSGSNDNEDGEEDGSSEGEGSDDDDEDASDGSSSGDSDGAGDEEGENSSSASGDDSDDDDSSESNNADVNASDSDDAGDESSAGASGGQPWSETDTAQRDNEESLVESDDSKFDLVYSQVPKDDAFNLDNIIIPHKQIFDTMTKYLANEVSSNEGDGAHYPAGTDPIAIAKADLKKFKNANAKIVNYMAKEFEMRKAADASARAATSKTGVLDTTTLHSYKWNEDVFKKITNIPDGKSHGLVMFLDWSGSMHSNMPGSLDQILNLVMFCKKVNIPFDVYAFSDHTGRGGYRGGEQDYSFTIDEPMSRDKLAKGDYYLKKGSHFRLLQLASSKGKTSEYNNMLLGLMMLRGHFDHGSYYSPSYNASKEGYHYYPMPSSLQLGGTPLNEAIISAIPIVNKLRADNNLQIVNTVFVTDGCGSELSYIWSPGDTNLRSWRSKVVIRDQKSKLEFTNSSHEGQLTALLDIFRVRTGGTKIVNFYITNPKAAAFKNVYDTVAKKPKTMGDSDVDGYRYGRKPATPESAEAYKIAKADGGVVIEDSLAGWDHYYLIMGGDSMEIKDMGLGKSLVGAKKNELKKAFSKSSSGKLRNRVLLRKFTELIAA